MADDDQRIVSIEDARRRRRERELEEQVRGGDETGSGGELRISDAMSHLLDDDAELPDGSSAGHLRQIVEREFDDE